MRRLDASIRIDKMVRIMKTKNASVYACMRERGVKGTMNQKSSDAEPECGIRERRVARAREKVSHPPSTQC